MLKEINEANKLEKRAVHAVRALLGNVPNVEFGPVDYGHDVGRNYQIDGRICLSHGDVDYALIIEVKSNGAPQMVRSAIYQLESCLSYLHSSGYADGGRRLIPMVVSPYLSPKSRSICSEHGFAYADLVGNAHLAFGGVYIERSVADKPKAETRALRSVFSPRAAAILRVMLRNPDRVWLVTELAERAKASVGHVSNVRKALLEREWIEKRAGGVALVQPDELLRTWRENYRRSGGRSISGYTHLHGEQLDAALSGVLNVQTDRPRAILALNSAAQWIAPFVRDGTQAFYADEAGVELLSETTRLRRAAVAANVFVHIPTDESLFDDAIETIPGVFCTNEIVTYLDLWCGNDREREAAEHLARESFPWRR